MSGTAQGAGAVACDGCHAASHVVLVTKHSLFSLSLSGAHAAGSTSCCESETGMNVLYTIAIHTRVTLGGRDRRSVGQQMVCYLHRVQVCMYNMHSHRPLWRAVTLGHYNICLTFQQHSKVSKSAAGMLWLSVPTSNKRELVVVAGTAWKHNTTTTGIERHHTLVAPVYSTNKMAMPAPGVLAKTCLETDTPASSLPA